MWIMGCIWLQRYFVVFCEGGRRVFVLGAFVLGGFCPGGLCPTPPVDGVRRNSDSAEKTRKMAMPDSEKSQLTCVSVSAQYQSVRQRTDRQNCCFSICHIYIAR